MSKKYVLILGVSSGFGKEIAIGYAKKGYNIYGVHLDMGSAGDAVKLFKTELEKKYQIRAIFFNGNAAADETRKGVLEVIAKTEQPHLLHSLVHSLAFGALKPFIAADHSEMMTKKQVEMTMDVMANSLVY